LLLTLRGTPVVYYGDELAMPDAVIPRDRVLDPVGLLDDPERPGRDGARSPMPWSAEPGAGFSAPDVEPWLPLGELAGVNVAEQRADPDSALHLTRDLIALRRLEEDLRTGRYEEVVVADGLWAYRRGDGFLIALNLGSDAASLAVEGAIAIGTRRERDGEVVARSLLLAPGEGVVLRLARA
jgi:alpha-glucosidase